MMEFPLIFSETNFWLFLDTKVKEYKKYISFIHNHACGDITIILHITTGVYGDSNYTHPIWYCPVPIISFSTISLEYTIKVNANDCPLYAFEAGTVFTTKQSTEYTTVNDG